MELSIFNAVYQKVKTNDKVHDAVVLCGRDENREKKYFRLVIDPYVYIRKVNAPIWFGQVQTKDFKIKDVREKYVERVEKTNVVGLFNEPLLKLVTYGTNQAGVLKDLTRKLGREPPKGFMKLRTYEAHLSQPTRIPLRALVDYEIKSGLRIEKKKGKFKLTPIDKKCPLRVWILDFEALSKLINSVNPKRDEPLLMLTFWDSYLDEFITIYWNLIPLQFRPLLPNHKIIWTRSEETFLRRTLYYLELYNPDVLVAHNLQRYDLIKWILRLKRFRISDTLLSPKEFRRVDRRRIPINIQGRVCFDFLEAFKQYTSKEMESYALDFIVEKEKDKLEGLIKIPFVEGISQIWHSKEPLTEDYCKEVYDILKEKGFPEPFIRQYIILVRNLRDVQIVKRLMEEYELLDYFDGLRREFGCLFNDVLMKSRLIETALLRMVKGRKAIPSSAIFKPKGGSFKGGLVIEPVPGHYENVVLIDFSRYYPHAIKAANISPETYVKSGRGKFKIRDEEGNVLFSFRSKPTGLMVELVDYFFGLRDNYEKLMTKAAKEKNEEEYKKYENARNFVKFATNALFGVMGFETFPLYRKPCAEAVTFIGRSGVAKSAELLKRLGYETRYGDTDSLFYQMKKGESVEDVLKIIEHLNTELSKYAKKEWGLKTSPFSFSPKKIYSDIIFFTKKLYAGKYIWDEKKRDLPEGDYDLKGIPAIRSDSSDVEKKLQKTVVEMVLDHKPMKEIEKFYKEIVTNLRNKEYKPIEVAYPLQIVRPMRSYIKTLPAHVKAAYISNFKFGTDFRAGDKPRRLPLSPKKLSPRLARPVMIHDKIRKVNCVAIDEYFPLSDDILRAIDWKAIEKRLIGRYKMVMKAVGEKKRQVKLTSFQTEKNREKK